LNNRVIYADVLRIFATFSVVLLHVAASNWSFVGLESFEWNIFNFYDSLVRFGVPIFVMISGSFFLNLNKSVSYKEIYKKYIPKILIAYFSWSLLYALYSNFTNNDSFNIDIFVEELIFGHYHMWYLFMLIGLYIITPLLRKIVADKNATEYFLLLSILFTFTIPAVIKIFNLENLELLINKIDFHFTLGYVGYYVGGHYLYTYGIRKEYRKYIYILGFISIISTMVLTDIISIITGEASSIFYSYFSPTVMVASMSVFIFFKYEVSKINFSEKSLKIIEVLSSCSFRIYLVHDFFNILLSKLGINTMTFNPVISVPIIAIFVYFFSFLASYIISKIPVFKKIF